MSTVQDMYAAALVVAEIEEYGTLDQRRALRAALHGAAFDLTDLLADPGLMPPKGDQIRAELDRIMAGYLRSGGRK